ncbi:MAG: FUSC family protein [Nocardioidaceae bacterium]
MATWMRQTWRDPVAWTEVIQIFKTAVAAAVAWVLAAEVFALPQPFLAPWAALLVVHSTVYRTFSQGALQVVATVLGVVLAWAVGNTLGLDPVALAVMLALGLVIGRLSRLREQSTTVAATALIVLTTGFSDQDQVLLGRLLDTAIGIAVGLAVNLVVWPPLRDLSAARAVDAIDDQVGDLLAEMARELGQDGGTEAAQAWVERTQRIDLAIDEAWALLRQARESGRLNPRRASRTVRTFDCLAELLERIEQAVAEARSMARTLDHSITNLNEWDPEFRERWLDLLGDAGRAIADPDSVRIAEVRMRLAGLASDFSTENLSALHWPEYGGLIMNLRNIVASMGEVAAANPVLPQRMHRG